MSKLRRKFIAVLAVLFCALLALSTALMIPKNKTAGAYTYVPTTNVPELIIDNGTGTTFNYDNLKTLYGKLVSGATTYDDVKSALNSSMNTMGAIHQGNFADPNNVIVEFGGLKWVAVYLSKATTAHASVGGAAAPGTPGAANDGDAVLTLWLANPTETSNFNSYQSSGTANGNYGGTYPSNMYGTSYMRAVVLGNGGQYATSENGALTTASSAEINGSSYAKFATGALKDYLVSPRYIGWQYEQHAKYDASNPSGSPSQHITTDLINDAWGVGNSTANGFPHNINYEDRPGYSAWKDDLVWLPSMTEVGSIAQYETGDAIHGIWHATQTQREITDPNRVWSRSAYTAYTGIGTSNASQTGKGFYLQNAFIMNAASGDSARYVMEIYILVRPAIHLNLAAADGNRGIAFGPTGTTITDEDDVKIASKEATYNGNAVSITIPDKDEQTVVGGNYNDGTGVFSATNPNETSDKTYEISVTPKENYVWKDTTDPDERVATRKYRIKIKLAEISVGWDPDPGTIATGQSLLQDSELITVQGSQTIVQKIYVAKPPNAETETPPTDEQEWTERSEETENNFLAEDTGIHRVHYKITAKYHKPKEGHYDVNVSADSMKITFDGDAAIATAAKYAEGRALDLADENQTWLKQTFRNKVTMTPSSTGVAYSSSEKQALFENLKIVIYKYNGNVRTTATPNSRGYFDVGTYYLAVQYASGSGAFTFTYDTDTSVSPSRPKYPTFTIEKRLATVKAVASADDGSLTHVYGDEPVSMKWQIVNGNAPKEDETHLGITEGLFKAKETGEELDSHTPAGTYHIEGEVEESSNYSITFDDSAVYEIEKRAITLQVMDETAEYGTDFSKYTFKAMTVKDGTLISPDTVSSLTSGATYTLTRNGIDVDFSNTLFISEYELHATVTADNYEFTILPGKLTITKANYNMSDVTLTNAGYIYDGNPHPAQISGTLPSSDISVSYRYVDYNTGEELTEPPTEVGLYLVYASFTHSNDNYNEIIDKVAYIRIAYTEEELNQGFPSLPTDAELAAAANVAKKKAEAKKTLDEEAKKKKQEIDDNPDLTDKEKEDAKKKVDEELAKGNAAIDSATSVDGVNQAYNDGKANIEKIKVEHIEESSFPWWILAVIGGALLLLILLIIIIVKRRNSEDEEEDYYDDEYDYDDEEVDEEYEDDGSGYDF